LHRLATEADELIRRENGCDLRFEDAFFVVHVGEVLGRERARGEVERAHRARRRERDADCVERVVGLGHADVDVGSLLADEREEEGVFVVTMVSDEVERLGEQDAGGVLAGGVSLSAAERRRSSR
jgi:hypothetical protein